MELVANANLMSPQEVAAFGEVIKFVRVGGSYRFSNGAVFNHIDMLSVGEQAESAGTLFVFPRSHFYIENMWSTTLRKDLKELPHRIGLPMRAKPL